MGKRVAAQPGTSRRTRRVIIWSIVGLVVLLVAFVAVWVGVRGVMAKDALEKAIPLAQSIKHSLLDKDIDGAKSQLGQLEKLTGSARSLTGDPVWRAAEFVPFAGGNLAAVRASAEIVDDVSSKALRPVLDVANNVLDIKPVDGKIDLAPILAARDAVVSANEIISHGVDRADRISTSNTIPQVGAAVLKLRSVLSDAEDILGPATEAVKLLPGLLGADGPRTYLLMFQNNAETRALGGNPSSLSLVTVDNGAIDLAGQGGGATLQQGVPAFPLDPAMMAAFASNVGETDITGFIQNVTFIPDFPTAATLAKTLWERTYGGSIDGVIAVDPIALSYLLGASGPVALPSGDLLTAENVVPLVLSEVYARYVVPADQDAFFASTAKAVFDAIKSGQGKPTKYIDALTKAGNEGRLLVWSAAPAEQKLLSGLRIGGILPASNEPDTTVGVYFNDLTTGKLTYYLNPTVEVSAPTCSPDPFAVTAQMTLNSLVPPDAADSLPRYVLGFSKDGTITMNYMVVGPVGSTYASSTAGEGAAVVSGADWHGRPVVLFQAKLRPGATIVSTATFTAPAGKYGPIDLRVTPLVVSGKKTVSTSPCK